MWQTVGSSLSSIAICNKEESVRKEEQRLEQVQVAFFQATTPQMRNFYQGFDLPDQVAALFEQSCDPRELAADHEQIARESGDQQRDEDDRENYQRRHERTLSRTRPRKR